MKRKKKHSAGKKRGKDEAKVQRLGTRGEEEEKERPDERASQAIHFGNSTVDSLRTSLFCFFSFFSLSWTIVHLTAFTSDRPSYCRDVHTIDRPTWD